jgi:pSer/pThr/pTyr-binding forkhead associated (FHA) protein
MPNRLTLHFPELDAAVELDPRRKTVLGISETCDIDLRRYLPAQGIRTISRRHCEIAFIPDEGYVITDLNSLNGTRVNEQSLRPGEPRFLRDGDTVLLADNPDFLLRVVSDEDPHTELLVPLGKPGLAPGPGPDLMTGHLYLAEDGHFVLDDTRISRQHLTVLEEKLLLYLYERAGRVCTYDEILRDVWGYARYDEIQDNTVAKTVSNLRKKLDDITPGAGMRHVCTVRGRGLTCTPV